MTEIKYLIKFMAKEPKHVKTLLKERAFFTWPVGYYCDLEKGQGDSGEADVLYRPLDYTANNWNINFKKSAGFHVFCCYAVKNYDVVGNRIANIDRRCINDFFGETGGYILVFDYNEFVQAVMQSEIKHTKMGLVEYRNLCFNDEFNFLYYNTQDNIMIKKPGFSYQNEFRVIFDNDSPGKPFGEERADGSICIKLRYEHNKIRFNYKLMTIDGKVFSDEDLIEQDAEHFSLDLSGGKGAESIYIEQQEA